MNQVVSCSRVDILVHSAERRSRVRGIISVPFLAAITLFPVVVAWPTSSGSDKRQTLSRNSVPDRKICWREQRSVETGLRSQPKCSSRLNMIALGCRSDEPCRARRESNIDRRSSGLTSSQEGASREKGRVVVSMRGWVALEGATARVRQRRETAVREREELG